MRRSNGPGGALLALTSALTILLTSFVAAPKVEAHCPAVQHAYQHVTASKQQLNNDGARAKFGWVNPAVCTPTDGPGFSAEWITTCDFECDLGRDGWVQVGLIKRTGWAEPKWYCEFAASEGGGGFGPPPWIVEFVDLQESTILYQAYHTASDWKCAIRGVNMASKTTSWMGFSFGDVVLVGGEAISPHTQVGTMSPGKFLFSEIKYAVSTTWTSVNLVCCDVPPVPYGKDEPALAQFRNWTVPH